MSKKVALGQNKPLQATAAQTSARRPSTNPNEPKTKTQNRRTSKRLSEKEVTLKEVRRKSKLFTSKGAEFEQEALKIHNDHRKEHGVPPLVLSKEICKISQKWAEELAKKDAMSYSNNRNYGESVYCGWSSDPNTKVRAQDCVDKWYNEINDYSFGKEPEILKCGHFTQIVWKDTKELGIGYAKSKSGKTYVVANYNPPGNYSGHFTKNVLPPGANQFKTQRIIHSETPATTTNNNLPTPPANKSKNLGDLVNKLKSSNIAGEKFDKFEEDCLQAHNEYRKKHGVPPLQLNNKLSKYAEEWAKVLVKKNKMQHRDQNDYGENIFYAWSSDPNFVVNGKAPVEKWYSEIKDHKFGTEPTSLGTGHFTQVVWEDTREVGVGVARSKDGHVYVVANYFPPGNMVGSFSKKVHAPRN